jgi:hypothetical protein
LALSKAGLGDFESVLDRERCYRIVDGSDGQVVGQDAESSGVGGVGDTHFLAFWVDVSVAADLVVETIAIVGSGLPRVSVRGLAYPGCNMTGWNSMVSMWSGRSNWIVSSTISTISTISKELSFGSNSKHQQTGDLRIWEKPNYIKIYISKN